MNRPAGVPESPGGSSETAMSDSTLNGGESPQVCCPIATPVRRRRRPPYSYTALIAQAIILSQYKQLTLREIYDSINRMYPQLCQGPDIGWQNTIRHNLSLNQCFKRIPRNQLPASLSAKLRGKGSYWTVDSSLMDPNTRKRLDEAVSSMQETPAPAQLSDVCDAAQQLSSMRTLGYGPTSRNTGTRQTSRQWRNDSHPYRPSERTVASRPAPNSSIRCVSPTPSLSPYFQSGMNSPITSVSRPAPKFPVQQLPPPNQTGRMHPFDSYAQVNSGVDVRSNRLPYGNGGQAFAAPLPASPYLLGTAVSRARSTVRPAGCGSRPDIAGDSFRASSSASTSALGSRENSPSPSPGPLASQAYGPSPRLDSSKLKIDSILN